MYSNDLYRQRERDNTGDRILSFFGGVACAFAAGPVAAVFPPAGAALATVAAPLIGYGLLGEAGARAGAAVGAAAGQVSYERGQQHYEQRHGQRWSLGHDLGMSSSSDRINTALGEPSAQPDSLEALLARNRQPRDTQGLNLSTSSTAERDLQAILELHRNSQASEASNIRRSSSSSALISPQDDNDSQVAEQSKHNWKKTAAQAVVGAGAALATVGVMRAVEKSYSDAAHERLVDRKTNQLRGVRQQIQTLEAAIRACETGSRLQQAQIDEYREMIQTYRQQQIPLDEEGNELRQLIDKLEEQLNNSPAQCSGY